jgi:hypothetical protein
MKDIDVIKALECCYKLDTWCSPENQGKCPLYGDEEEHCDKHLLKLARNLIVEQKAEIEVLKDDVEFLDKHNDELIREIEKLQKVNESFSCMGKLYSEIKSEAYKEFADEIDYEILHKEFWNAHPHTSQVWLNGYEQCMRDIRVMLKDKLKELVGEDK